MELDLKIYLIKAYGYLVKVGRWDLEQVEGSDKKIVPESYRVSVVDYLVGEQIL